MNRIIRGKNNVSEIKADREDDEVSGVENQNENAGSDDSYEYVDPRECDPHYRLNASSLRREMRLARRREEGGVADDLHHRQESDFLSGGDTNSGSNSGPEFNDEEEDVSSSDDEEEQNDDDDDEEEQSDEEEEESSTDDEEEEEKSGDDEKEDEDDDNENEDGANDPSDDDENDGVGGHGGPPNGQHHHGAGGPRQEEDGPNGSRRTTTYAEIIDVSGDAIYVVLFRCIFSGIVNFWDFGACLRCIDAVLAIAKEKKALKAGVVDGVKEKVGSFRVEPPGLFPGRGEHRKMGSIRPSVIPGERWKEVQHDYTVIWQDPMNETKLKYVHLAASLLKVLIENPSVHPQV